MRIIFVGIHNKGDKKPLCPSTLSGKIISEICKRLPKEYKILRTNLYNLNRMPEADEINDTSEWYWTILPTEDDIIVLLGAFIHKHFKYTDFNIVKLPHPASSFYRTDGTNNYINNAVKKIIDKLFKLQ